MKSKWDETKLIILHELYEAGKKGVSREKLTKIAGGDKFDEVMSNLENNYIHTGDGGFKYTIKNEGRDLYKKLKQDELSEVQIEISKKQNEFNLHLAIFTALLVLTGLLTFIVDLTKEYFGLSKFYVLVLIVLIAIFMFLLIIIINILTKNFSKINIEKKIDFKKYKPNLSNVLFISLILGVAIISFIFWYNSTNENIPSYVHSIDFDGDYSQDSLIDYYFNFAGEQSILIDNIRGTELNVTLWDWQSLEKVEFFQEYYNGVQNVSIPLKYNLVGNTTYSISWAIHLPKNETGDVKIYLSKIRYNNESGTPKIQEIYPNGRFSFSNKYNFKSLRMRFYLGKYKTYNPYSYTETKNINLDYDPSENFIEINVKPESESDYNKYISFNLYTFDGNKKLEKEVLFALIISFLTLFLERVISLIISYRGTNDNNER